MAVTMILAILLYLQGGWKRSRMVTPPDEVECVETAMSEREPGGALSPTA